MSEFKVTKQHSGSCDLHVGLYSVSPPVGHRVDALVGRLSGLIDRFEKATDEIAKADNQRLFRSSFFH